jgi:hypothetical protein
MILKKRNAFDKIILFVFTGSMFLFLTTGCSKKDCEGDYGYKPEKPVNTGTDGTTGNTADSSQTSITRIR